MTVAPHVFEPDAIFTPTESERHTERTRLVATNYMEAREKLAELIAEGRRRQVWVGMKMRSLEEWLSATFSDTPLMRLSRDERKVIVADLAEQGMSSTAIAPVVGATDRTVRRDIESRTNVRDEPRVVKSIDGVERTFQPRPAPEPVTVDHDTGEITQPEPRKRPRRPIHETARTAAMNLREAADRLGIEVHDDRFPAIAEELAPQLRNQLAYVIETCQGYLDELAPNKE